MLESILFPAVPAGVRAEAQGRPLGTPSGGGCGDSLAREELDAHHKMIDRDNLYFMRSVRKLPLTVKTLTGMTTNVYPRENCIAPAIVFIVWTTNTKFSSELGSKKSSGEKDR